jgi:hypothetical protein
MLGYITATVFTTVTAGVIAVLCAASSKPDREIFGDAILWRQLIMAIGLICSVGSGVTSIVLVCRLHRVHRVLMTVARATGEGVNATETAMLLATEGVVGDTTIPTRCAACTAKAVWEVRLVARLTLLVPLYTISVLPSLLSPRSEWASFTDHFQNLVESVIAYTYWSLMVLYAGGYAQVTRDWASYLGLDEDGDELAKEERSGESGVVFSEAVACAICSGTLQPHFDHRPPPPRQVMSLASRRAVARKPLLVVLGRWLSLLYLTWDLALVPFVAVACCLTTDAGWLPSSATGTPLYKPGDLDVHHMFTFVNYSRGTLLACPLVLIIFFIFVLSRSTAHCDKSLKSKFITIKIIVFLSFWQQLVLGFFRKAGALNHFDGVVAAEPHRFPDMTVALRQYSDTGLSESVILTLLVAVELVLVSMLSWSIFDSPQLYWSFCHRAVCVEPLKGCGGGYLGVRDLVESLGSGWAVDYEMPAVRSSLPTAAAAELRVNTVSV